MNERFKSLSNAADAHDRMGPEVSNYHFSSFTCAMKGARSGTTTGL